MKTTSDWNKAPKNRLVTQNICTSVYTYIKKNIFLIIIKPCIGFLHIDYRIV